MKKIGVAFLTIDYKNQRPTDDCPLAQAGFDKTTLPPGAYYLMENGSVLSKEGKEALVNWEELKAFSRWLSFIPINPKLSF